MREPLRKSLTRQLLASTSLIAALAAAAPATAQQVLPTNGSVASGAASISQSGAAMTIQQTTPRAVINWNSFSVGAPNSVTFAQPNASSATLNRVTGSTPSSIAGQINANGQVYLVNPNGIAITRGGTVNVGGGFVASTLSITDDNFNNGKLIFTGAGASAAVSNDGTITAGAGEIVGLIGGSVSNSGTITAPLGKVALGSGEQATLDPTGDGFLQVALPTNATTADGKALVDVSGKVKAAGGTIAIKAATAANAVRNAINLSGVASARSARKVGGSIVLGGGDGGDVNVSGVADASGRQGGGSVRVTGRNVALNNARLTARSAGGQGGRVAVTGTGAVTLAGTAVDASGATAGGRISVGGGPGGKGALVHSTSTTIATSTLRADAMVSGNGGAIAVWSDGATSVSATLSARGGVVSGNGGAVETSGQTAQLNGAHVDTTAAHGATGLWTIDPDDFTIAASGGDITGAALSGELATTSITIHSTDNGHTGGEILVNDAVSWSSGSTLTLDASSNIIVNANISVQGAGGVAFIFGDTGQTGTGSTTNGALQFAITDAGSTASLTFSGAGGALSVNGAAYTLLRTEGSLAQLNGSAGNFALANDITLAQSYTGAVVPTFSGNLEGLGHTISNLVLTQGAAVTNVGFFGHLEAGEVSNVFLANANVSGGTANSVGVLAGELDNIVYNSGSSGTVTGSGASIGGLVGYNNNGLVQFGYSSANVTGSSTAGGQVGGLVGYNTGVVTTSFTSGAVQGDDFVGGLVGENIGYVNGGSSGFITGNAEIGGVVGENDATELPYLVFNGVTYPLSTIAGAYGYGGVYGTNYAGGVVGLNNATVTSSFFNGPVSGVSYIGGVAGANDDSISTSYAINAVSGTTYVGGLVGYNGGSITSSFAMGAVRGTTDVGGLVGLEGFADSDFGSSISSSYSTGAVSGPTTATGLGGLVGALSAGATDTQTNAYWNTETSGRLTSAGAGAVGETTLALQGGAALTLTGFAGGAAGGETNVYPYLTDLYPNGVRAISGVAYTNMAGTTALASSNNGAGMVYVDTAGSVRNPATTGVNGYYYVFLDPTTLVSGAAAVAYTAADTNPAPNTGATNAATYVENVTANNTTANILGTTLTETTALTAYSSLVTAVTNATAGDTTAPGAIGGVSYINITGTGAQFAVDQAISTTANLTVTSAKTLLEANVTATGGATFNGPVTVQSSAMVTEDSGGATTTFSSTLTIGAVGLSVTGSGGLTVNGAATVSGVFDLGGFARSIATVNLAGGALQNGGLTGAVISTGGAINGLSGSASVTTTAGTTTLSGTNGYTGATTVTGGTLTASSANAFSAGSTTTINTGGTVDLGGLAQSIATVNLNGGALQNGGLTGAIISTGGSIIGLSAGLLTTTGGTTTLSGVDVFTGIANGATAAIVNAGTTTDDLNNAGTYTNNGTENANVASNTGTITNSTGANWNGNVNAGANTAGGLITNLGTWTGTGNNAGGTINNGGTWAGALDNTAGTFNNNAGGTVSGLVTNAGTGTNAGTLASLSNTGGTFSNTNAITGAATVSGGAVTNSGTIFGLATVTAGTLTTTGTLGGGVTNAGTVNAAGTINGAINNQPGGLFTVTGGLDSDNASTFANAAGATLDVKAGAFANLATLNNAGTVTVENTLSAGAITNTGTLTATGQITTTGAFTNAGTANLGPVFFGGAVTNTSAMNVNGAAVLDGNVTNTGTLAFNAPVTINANLTIDSTGGSLSFGSTIDSGTTTIPYPTCYSDCTTTAANNLTITGGSLAFSGAIGGQYTLGAVSITAPGSLSLPAITAASIFARSTGGDITLNGVLTASGSGTAVTLAAADAFINKAGSGAIVLTGDPPNWLIYSNNPTADSFGGLNSNNRAIWNTTYPAATPPTNGDYYLFAYQPTVTFTSINDSKTYGQDVTARVATDYTVSGLQPAVSGAYLGDTAATAYSGAPSVTSAGSPASASVAGSPYAITVAQGSLAAINGYALAFASPGQLSVGAEAITISAAANSKVYNATTVAAAAPTVTTGTLYDPATLTETYSTPNAGTGLTLAPQIAFASPAAAGNYIVTLTPAQTGTITPEPITVTATPNTKVFDGNTSAAALPTLTAGTLFDPATLSETYATPGPGGAIVLNPAIAFNAQTAAANYAVTLVPTGTTPPNTGVILPPALTQVNLSPSVFVDRNPLIGIPGEASTCGPDVQLPDPSSFADPVAAVQAISAATSQYVERCRDASQEDIANALERYADALEVIIQKLPPRLRAQLQHIPQMVRAAAVRARAAPTRAAAVRVLRQTVAQVHREIALVRAEDPDSARIRNAVSTGVSGVLNSAAVALARSEGI